MRLQWFVHIHGHHVVSYAYNHTADSIPVLCYKDKIRVKMIKNESF